MCCSGSVNRHAELVSGSISRFDRSYGWQAQTHRQVLPLRIGGVDEVDLPLPVPALQLLLTGDGAFHVAEHFEADEQVNVVALGKTLLRLLAMLPPSGDQVRGAPTYSMP
jgi:hypothetical protein